MQKSIQCLNQSRIAIVQRYYSSLKPVNRKTTACMQKNLP
uniref:Uncharacterized protein n=1 Tax=Rhizophora mucronata TaxID=61149 RepID=A0A2P2QX97_RHIMU